MAALESHDELSTPRRLFVVVSRAEAHLIYHELRTEKTVPGQTLDLLAEVVAQLDGKLAAVEVRAGADGSPTAQLRMERPPNRVMVSVPAGQALVLAVHLRVPLLVSEALLQRRPTTGAPADVPGAAPPSGEVSAALTEIPDAFLRAFEE
ncbi:MAG: bifunctional nuclease family protein [Chloroflexi bacterium]|nr:bifunctional nuclease family protein [Chloroflexota bacterium]